LPDRRSTIIVAEHATSPQNVVRPVGRRALGEALDARRQAISRDVLERWRARCPNSSAAAEPRVLSDILRTTELATAAMVSYLTQGAHQSEEQAQIVAATGKAPLRDMISLADLTKLYLYWRDLTIEALESEAAQLGVAVHDVAHAVAAVRFGSDGSIVRMAKQFDAERQRLQRELSIEQSRLAHQAFHDALTGLPNRRLFFDRLTHALDVARRRESGVALLFIDVDNLKRINDGLGHLVGDALLVEVANRFLAVVRASDTVARFGGDEFVVVQEGVTDVRAEANCLAGRLARAMDAPFVSGGRPLTFSASIGIAISNDGDDADSLVRRADQAMYAAKRKRPVHADR
jgi:diguanylate cyclase (GGDEF)-like protein